MRRLMAPISVAAVVALSALALAAWEWRQCAPSNRPTADPRGEIGAAPGGHEQAERAPVKPLAQPDSSTGDEPDPPYWKYPVYYGAIEEKGVFHTENGGARVGFCQAGDDLFYAWKDVYVDVLRIPAFFDPFQGERLVNYEPSKVVEVDPPVFYMPLADGLAAPGYYTGGFVRTTFFRWKGITLKREEIPLSARGKRLLSDRQVQYILEIKPPKHVVEQPDLWKAP